MTSKRRHLPPVALALGLGGLFVVQLAAVLVPGLERGLPLREVLGRELGGLQWLGQLFLPLLFTALVLLVGLPAGARWLMRVRPAGGRRYSWNRYRWILTGLLLLALGAAGAGLALESLAVRPGLAAALAALAAVTLAALWLRRDDPDFVEAFEHEDDERWRDERHQAVVGRAAQSALLAMLVLLVVGGGLYDVLVTHAWPVRSLAEAAALGLFWNLAYGYWNRRS